MEGGQFERPAEIMPRKRGIKSAKTGEKNSPWMNLCTEGACGQFMAERVCKGKNSKFRKDRINSKKKAGMRACVEGAGGLQVGHGGKKGF